MTGGQRAATRPEPGEELGTAATELPIGDAPSAGALGARPCGDELVRAMARARVAGALFAAAEPVKIGRYQLLEIVGTGGMGVVWGAWDPELDRRVAIKVLDVTMQAARERIAGEGQALARLSHPNVVPIYDVGVVDDRVYLVMEWVRGKNLRSFASAPRTVAELVAVYRAAGEGLAAAHRAHLVHRDFKPENAILGNDGRVRVLDFGLARGEVRASDDGAAAPSGEVTRGAGTPRYMAPEQADGTAVTPAVDQYALCVSLREALIGRRGDGRPADVPGWLARVLDRGTAHAAEDRYPSIDDLVHALARDPATVWRRRLVAGGVAAAVATAFVIGTQRAAAPEAARCGDGADELARSWNPAVRGRIAGHLQTLGAYGAAEAERLGAMLDRYGERWAAAHRGACQARARDEITAEHAQRNLGCLARTRVALDTLLEVLARVDRERLADAAGAAGTLPDAGDCLDTTRDAAVAAPPPERAAEVAELDRELQRVEVLARAIAPDAVERAESTERTAERVGDAILTARASWVHGLALVQQHRRGEAAVVLGRAAERAFAAGDPRTGILAYAQELHEALREIDPAKRPANAGTLAGAIPIVSAIAQSLGPAGSHERAFLYNSVGTMRMMDKDMAGARRAFLDAAREQALSANQVDLAWIWGNLAIVTDDPIERDRLLGRYSLEIERVYGPDHPLALQSRLLAGMLTLDADRAIAAMQLRCRRFAALHPHLRGQLANHWFEIGQMLHDRGDAAGAREAFAQLPRDDSEATIAAGYLRLLDGEPGDAIAAMNRLAAKLLRDEHAWVQMRASDALYVAALGEIALGRTGDAARDLRRAIELLGRAERIHEQRRLARIQTAMAHALIRTQPGTARTFARAALAWSRAAGGYEARVAELAVMDSR